MNLLELIENMAVAGLCVVIITPIVSGEGTWLGSPAALITLAGMWMKIITVAWQAHDDIIAFTESGESPLWVNDCLQDEF